MRMSETTAVESLAPPEVQSQAEKMGWIPPSRFRGDPERFVDADVYIERGETVLPIVKEQNKRLHAEVEGLRAESAKTAAALKAAETAIAQIEERHTVETQKAVEAARRQVKAQLSAASEAGDHEGVAELTDQLTQLSVVVPEKPTKQLERREAPAPFAPPPDLREWNTENPWFGPDKRKTALALGIAQEFRDAGDTSVGRSFYEKVGAEVARVLGETSGAPRGDKVEGARGGFSEGEGRGSGRKSYAALPADAKAACDAETRRFVGEGKRYKTAAEWRTRYAEIYFGE
jgi:hypothetical protein